MAQAGVPLRQNGYKLLVQLPVGLSGICPFASRRSGFNWCKCIEDVMIPWSPVTIASQVRTTEMQPLMTSAQQSPDWNVLGFF
eukprot:3214830-Amphidinium_carterae.1